MNRLQKKCVIVTAGLHLLLLAILFLGPAFFNSRPKVDNSPVLDVIPANLIDAAFNSGVKGAMPPPPQPVAVPQPPAPQPQQQPVQPTPRLIQPAPTPTPTFMSEVKHFFTPEPKPELINPTPEPDQTQPHKIVIDTHLVTGPVSQTTPRTTHTDHSQDRAKAFNNALRNLQHNLSSATEVNMPSDSSVAYANYGSVVVSVYHSAWEPPSGMSSDNVTVKFKVKIASDGTVISSEIIDSSGDSDVDSAVQRMIDRVTFIAPFPDGTTDKERAYTIDFNATH